MLVLSIRNAGTTTLNIRELVLSCKTGGKSPLRVDQFVGPKCSYIPKLASVTWVLASALTIRRHNRIGIVDSWLADHRIQIIDIDSVKNAYYPYSILPIHVYKQYITFKSLKTIKIILISPFHNFYYSSCSLTWGRPFYLFSFRRDRSVLYCVWRSTISKL